jgi:O-antigen/teichoic acid export membrane protein
MILSISIFPLFLQSVAQSLLYASGRYKDLNWGLGVGLLVQAIVDVLLITNFGLKGAATAFLVAESVIFVCFTAFAIRAFGRVQVAVAGKIMACALAAIILTMFGLRYHVSVPLVFISALTFYLLALFSLRCITARDFQFGKSMLATILQGRT